MRWYAISLGREIVPFGGWGQGVVSSSIKIIPLYSVNQSPVFSGVLALHSLSLSVKRTPGETSPVDHPMGSLRTVRNSKNSEILIPVPSTKGYGGENPGFYLGNQPHFKKNDKEFALFWILVLRIHHLEQNTRCRCPTPCYCLMYNSTHGS